MPSSSSGRKGALEKLSEWQPMVVEERMLSPTVECYNRNLRGGDLASRLERYIQQHRLSSNCDIRKRTGLQDQQLGQSSDENCYFINQLRNNENNCEGDILQETPESEASQRELVQSKIPCHGRWADALAKVMEALSIEEKPIDPASSEHKKVEHETFLDNNEKEVSPADEAVCIGAEASKYQYTIDHLTQGLDYFIRRLDDEMKENANLRMQLSNAKEQAEVYKQKAASYELDLMHVHSRQDMTRREKQLSFKEKKCLISSVAEEEKESYSKKDPTAQIPVNDNRANSSPSQLIRKSSMNSPNRAFTSNVSSRKLNGLWKSRSGALETRPLSMSWKSSGAFNTESIKQLSKFIDLAFLQQGAMFRMATSSKNAIKNKYVKLSVDPRFLEWPRAWYKMKKVERTDLTRIIRVQKGQKTKFFEKRKKMLGSFESTSFSLIYGNSSSKSIDMIAPTPHIHQQWYIGLSYLIDEFKEEELSISPEIRYINAKWNSADLNGDGSLSKEEILSLVHAMNINMPRKEIVEIYERVDHDGNDTLNFQEFCDFMCVLRRREDITVIWANLGAKMSTDNIQEAPSEDKSKSFSVKRKLNKIKKSSPETLTPDDKISWKDFCKFWQCCQKESMSRHVIERLENINISGFVDGKPPQAVSYNMFNDILCSCYAFDSEKKDLYQDMTRPLPDYYIATSHNTYLTGDQLQSQSSCQRYIDDLVKGCRCVEIDTWDGGSGENFQPVVYHGHTLTSKVSFADVVETCAEYCFKTSPYPVILSLENHCSLEQQGIMADILKEAFGDMLMLPGEMIGETLPSPEQLRNRVLVKGRRHRSLCRRQRSDGGTEYFLGDRRGASCLDSGIDNTPDVMGDGDESDDEFKDHDENRTSFDNAKRGHVVVHPSLEAITYLKSVNIRHIKFDELESKLSPDTVLSCSENKFSRIYSESDRLENFVAVCKTNILRCYPKATRVSSSNMNPLNMWAIGGQCIALNYQTAGPMMHLNDSKFLENGQCGFVLKPPQLTNVNESETCSQMIRLRIQIISAQMLPKPDSDVRGEVIDPYVTVQIYEGVTSKSLQPEKTATIQDNGFNPIWNELFTFDITKPESSFLYITVMDEDGPLEKDDFIGYAAVPIHCLNEGYRHLRVFDNNGSRQGDYTYATLFCRIHIDPICDEDCDA